MSTSVDVWIDPEPRIDVMLHGEGIRTVINIDDVALRMDTDDARALVAAITAALNVSTLPAGGREDGTTAPAGSPAGATPPAPANGGAE